VEVDGLPVPGEIGKRHVGDQDSASGDEHRTGKAAQDSVLGTRE
jgi:hypothetical protein